MDKDGVTWERKRGTYIQIHVEGGEWRVYRGV